MSEHDDLGEGEDINDNFIDFVTFMKFMEVYRSGVFPNMRDEAARLGTGISGRRWEIILDTYPVLYRKYIRE